MECKNCPMRLFEVKVYKKELIPGCRKRYQLIEDKAISPTWMSKEDIKAINEQFDSSTSINDNVRKVIETDTSRCIGYSKIDENAASSKNKPNVSSYGKVVIYKGEKTNTYNEECNIKRKWTNTIAWKVLLAKYKNMSDDWY